MREKENLPSGKSAGIGRNKRAHTENRWWKNPNRQPNERLFSTLNRPETFYRRKQNQVQTVFFSVFRFFGGKIGRPNDRHGRQFVHSVAYQYCFHRPRTPFRLIHSRLNERNNRNKNKNAIFGILPLAVDLLWIIFCCATAYRSG